MKKSFSLLAGFLLTNVLYSQAISGANENGLDMNTYASWAGYGFFVILGLGFAYFLYITSPEAEVRLLLNQKKPVFKSVFTLKQASGINRLIKLVNYSIISLILIYISILLLALS
jgi:hypothetical protein